MFVNNLLIGLAVLTLLNTVKSDDKFGQLDILRHSNANFNQPVKREIKSRHRRDNEDESDVGWSIINEEVDTVIPLLLEHLQKLQIEHLQLPDIKENLSVKPLFLTYEAGLYLTNGIVYNVAGIQRYGPAYMTYEDKSFLTRFYLNIKNLQLRAIIRIFLHELINKTPENIHEFSAALFNSNNSPLLVTKINQQLKRVNENFKQSHWSQYDGEMFFSKTDSTHSLLSRTSIGTDVDNMLRYAMIMRDRK